MRQDDEHEAILEALADARAFPADAGASGTVARIDTHISHVFLAGTRVYKLRRPVRLAFLDFSELSERNQDCLREVSLNRRLAPDVYLGVAPVLRSPSSSHGSRFLIGETGEQLSASGDAVEHCVVMRRLPAGRDMKSLLAAGAIEPRHIDAVAARMAAFHAAHTLGTPGPFDVASWLARTTAPARGNIDALLQLASPCVERVRVEAVARAAEQFAAEHAPDFEQRLLRGRVVDAHGDLHCEHVWFESDDAEPLMVDCLEFREDFRRIDAASDIAFLAMDLQYRGRPDLSARLLRRYARDSGDYHLYSVIDFFLSYRAMVRAKVAALVAGDEALAAGQRDGARESARGHLDLASSYLAPRRGRVLVLVSGTVGAGKTTLAEELADALAAVVVSSDRVRKDRAGLAATDRAAAAHGQGLYALQSRDAVYAAMLEEAAPAIGAGRPVILDATFARRAWRQQAAHWARARGIEAWVVEARAEERVVMERLAARSRRGTDASDAGPELYARVTAEMEAAGEWPAQRKQQVDMGSADWRREAAEVASRIAATMR
ncbi:MAG TPA: AAA family ATPase [Candidatus Limnocylindrales bacterium]|nr:AAA family ATPase [Candidatus Limnocylindrales bacterium]